MKHLSTDKGGGSMMGCLLYLLAGMEEAWDFSPKQCTGYRMLPFRLGQLRWE